MWGRLSVGVVLAGISLVALPSSALSVTGSGCQFSATTHFSPPLKSASQPFSYELDGVLSNCASSDLAAPSDGAVSAGKPGMTIQGVTFDQPVPTGNGGCREASASGTLWTVWNDGTVTILDYSTTGVAAALLLTATVAASKTVTGTDGLPHTITTTRYRDQSAIAAFATRVDDPTQCSGPGVPFAVLDGPFMLAGGDADS